jgi:hypothetical protein
MKTGIKGENVFDIIWRVREQFISSEISHAVSYVN